MDEDVYKLLLVIGESYRRLKQHADSIKKHSNVVSVVRAIDMPALKGGFRLESYVDAKLITGESISWCLEITATLERIVVEADVRRIHEKGQDVLLSVAECVELTETSWSALPDITNTLCMFCPTEVGKTGT